MVEKFDVPEKRSSSGFAEAFLCRRIDRMDGEHVVLISHPRLWEDQGSMSSYMEYMNETPLTIVSRTVSVYCSVPVSFGVGKV